MISSWETEALSRRRGPAPLSQQGAGSGPLSAARSSSFFVPPRDRGRRAGAVGEVGGLGFFCDSSPLLGADGSVEDGLNGYIRAKRSHFATVPPGGATTGAYGGGPTLCSLPLGRRHAWPFGFWPRAPRSGPSPIRVGASAALPRESFGTADHHLLVVRGGTEAAVGPEGAARRDLPHVTPAGWEKWAALAGALPAR